MEDPRGEDAVLRGLRAPRGLTGGGGPRGDRARGEDGPRRTVSRRWWLGVGASCAFTAARHSTRDPRVYF